ncbi:carbohydrate ABC transporter permease [Clostridium sp. DL1XJH146]
MSMINFKLSNLSYKKQRIIIIAAFLIIPLFLLLTFSFWPLEKMIVYSFYDWNGFSKNKEFVGFENYITVFTRPEYFSVFKVSLYYLVGSFVQMALALYFATILSAKVRGKNIFKAILFFPYLLNGVAVGFVFLFFFKPTGTLDTVMNLMGLGAFTQKWLGNPDLINISLAGASIWRYIGFNFIIFLGAIQSIPGSIYEAAEIDGASKWHQFKYIIFPSIKRIIELNLILAIKGALSVFEIPFIMTDGANGSKTFVIQTLDTAFEFGKFGLASAMAVVLLIIVIITAIIQKKFFRDKEA